jgi:hypothetical protein
MLLSANVRHSIVSMQGRLNRRRLVRALIAAALLGVGVVAMPMDAYAATITEPSGDTVEVGLDAEKYPAPFTVTAEGFEPYTNVFIEQCNGRPPSAANWTPTIDCDFGSAPAAAIADENGRVTFSATDRNHAPFLFVGPSPQELFNCLSPKMQSPGNLMEDYRNCQIRVSSSNTAGTDDQVFLTLKLPEGARAGTRKPPEPIAAATDAPSQAGASASETGAASSSGSKTAAADDPASSDSSSSSGSTSSFPYSAVLIPTVLVALGAAYFLLRKRRSGRVAA